MVYRIEITVNEDGSLLVESPMQLSQKEVANCCINAGLSTIEEYMGVDRQAACKLLIGTLSNPLTNNQ